MSGANPDSPGMDIQASIEQVAGILVREGLQFGTHCSGDSYRLIFGRDAVFVHFVSSGEHVRVAVTAPVLQHIEDDGPGACVATSRLNELNLEHRFVKWTYESGLLLATVDLLGDHLHSAELLNAVYALAALAEEVGDELEDETGGWRYDDVMACEADEEELEVEDE